jgi:hypothetical protein
MLSEGYLLCCSLHIVLFFQGENPLDFKFGQTTSIGFLSPSPTDPMAEQYITSFSSGLSPAQFCFYCLYEFAKSLLL